MDDKILEEVLKYALTAKRTSKQITEKLLKKGYDEDSVREAVEYYRENGYIDHKEYARCFVSDCVRLKGYGPERIKRELLARGVESDIAENALIGIEYDLPALMRKKFKSCQDKIEKQKIINYFVRRGFSYYEIESVLKEVFE